MPSTSRTSGSTLADALLSEARQRSRVDQELQKQICARIREAREKAGFTLEEASDALGISLRGYWNWEKNRVPFRRLRDVADLFGVTQEWLLRGDLAQESPGDYLEELGASVAELMAGQTEILTKLSQLEAVLERRTVGRTRSKRD